MTRSSRGALETPGSNVRQKSGLNRSLLGVAPSKQTAILVRSAERNGTRIELVPAHGTSRRCNACGYTHRKNRESQARFRCAACGHTDNADANAARNIRGPGRRLHPGADERVPGRWTPSSQRNRCRAEDRTAGGIWPSREGRPARKGACQGAIEVPALPRETGRHRNPGRKAEHRNPGLTARYRVDSQRGSSMRSESSVAVETEETATRYTFRIVPWFATGCHGGSRRHRPGQGRRTSDARRTRRGNGRGAPGRAPRAGRRPAPGRACRSRRARRPGPCCRAAASRAGSSRAARPSTCGCGHAGPSRRAMRPQQGLTSPEPRRDVVDTR